MGANEAEGCRTGVTQKHAEARQIFRLNGISNEGHLKSGGSVRICMMADIQRHRRSNRRKKKKTFIRNKSELNAS